MLNKLTDKQLEQLPKFRQKWLDIGLSTEPLNFEKAKECVKKVYAVAGLKEPEYFYHFSSPLSAAIGANMLTNTTTDQVWAQVWDQVVAQVVAQVGDQLWDQVVAQVRAQVGAQVRDQVRAQVGAQVRTQVGDQVRTQVGDQVGDQVRAQVRAQVWGCHDAGWLSFYDVFLSLGIDCHKLKPLMDLAKYCGWWAPYKNCAILQDRPSFIKFDDQKRLHSEIGPAVEYRDGFSVYSWHGTRIPEEWIKSGIEAKEAIKWENLEQRRAACEIVGWAEIIKQLNAKSIDRNINPLIGELLEVDIPDIGLEKYLKVECGTKRDFCLPVPPAMKTAHEANAWLHFKKPEDYKPEIRT